MNLTDVKLLAESLMAQHLVKGSIKVWLDTKAEIKIVSVDRQFDSAKRGVLDAFKRWEKEQQVA